MTTCVVDGRTVNGALLCAGCTATLSKVLHDCTELVEQLAVTKNRQAVTGPQDQQRTRRGDDTQPIPFHVGASEAEYTLVSTLTTWARDLDPDAQTRGDVLSVARWLRDHLDMIRQHTAVEQLYDEITYAVRQAWVVVDRPADRTRTPVAPCLNVGCDGTLVAYVPTDDYDEHDPRTHARITCDTCQETYRSDQWMRLGTRLRQRVAM